jgi:hypothetical protein
MRERILYINLTHNVFVRICGKPIRPERGPTAAARPGKQRHPVIIIYRYAAISAAAFLGGSDEKGNFNNHINIFARPVPSFCGRSLL